MDIKISVPKMRKIRIITEQTLQPNWFMILTALPSGQMQRWEKILHSHHRMMTDHMQVAERRKFAEHMQVAGRKQVGGRKRVAGHRQVAGRKQVAERKKVAERS